MLRTYIPSQSSGLRFPLESCVSLFNRASEPPGLSLVSLANRPTDQLVNRGAKFLPAPPSGFAWLEGYPSKITIHSPQYARRSPAASAASPSALDRRADCARCPVGAGDYSADGYPSRDTGGVTGSSGGRRAGPRLVGLVAGQRLGRRRSVLRLRGLQSRYGRDQSGPRQIAGPHD